MEIAVRDQARPLDEAVGERRFSVIDMRDDAKVPNSLGIHFNRSWRQGTSRRPGRFSTGQYIQSIAFHQLRCRRFLGQRWTSSPCFAGAAFAPLLA